MIAAVAVETPTTSRPRSTRPSTSNGCSSSVISKTRPLERVVLSRLLFLAFAAIVIPGKVSEIDGLVWGGLPGVIIVGARLSILSPTAATSRFNKLLIHRRIVRIKARTFS